MVPNAKGEPVINDSFYLLFIAHHEPIPFTLPERWEGCWERLPDTGESGGLGEVFEAGWQIRVGARPVVEQRQVG